MPFAERVYTTPIDQKLGDGFVFVWRVLLGTPALAFIYFALAFVAWRSFGDASRFGSGVTQQALWPVYALALALAFPLVVWLACRDVHWRLELHQDALRLGRLMGSESVPCDDVVLVRLGASPFVAGDGRLPLRLEPRARRAFTIWLEAPAAEQLFQELLRRCPHAAAIGRDGTPHVPQSSLDREGAKRLSRQQLVRGWAALILGSVTVAAAIAAPTAGGSGGDALAVVRRGLVRSVLIVQALGVVAYGVRALVRRRALRPAMRSP